MQTSESERLNDTPELALESKSEPERIFVKAYDIASSYDLKSARDVLEREYGGKVLIQDPLLVQLDWRKIVSVFDYGTLVFFNFEPKAARQIITTLAPCTTRPNAIVSEDDYILYLGARQRKPEGTEELYVKEFNKEIALLVSVVLSRSVSLEYYERLVNDALAQLEQTMMTLRKHGTVPRSQRTLTKQVGFALSVEHELAYNLSVFDDPDVVWDIGAKIGLLYKSLKGEFELEERIRTIQQKISIISRSSTFVISRLEAQRASLLEWIIIILILFEIILVLLGKL